MKKIIFLFFVFFAVSLPVQAGSDTYIGWGADNIREFVIDIPTKSPNTSFRAAQVFKGHYYNEIYKYDNMISLTGAYSANLGDLYAQVNAGLGIGSINATKYHENPYSLVAGASLKYKFAENWYVSVNVQEYLNINVTTKTAGFIYSFRF